ncbi:MAG: MFS transporter [Proteobacteria bacterium]|nr:MFS transporter [Pseudomonadota bacterium]
MDNSPTKKQAWFGWCMYDWANSSFATVILAAVLPVYFVTLVPEEGARISLFGWHRLLPASALWAYSVSLSMLIVAITAPYLGALADRKSLHRKFLITCCLVGSFTTGLLYFATPGRYIMAVFIFIFANISFAGGNIFYNAFLPKLAASHELDRLSSRGFAFGYIGGGLALLIVFAMIMGSESLGFPDKGAATRTGFLLTGIWWLLFAIPTFYFVRVHSAPILPQVLHKGIKGYFRTLAEIRHYPTLFLFLIAFLFYNDGIQTIIVVAAIFGRQELALSQGTILACFLMIQFVAMPGTLLFGKLAEIFGAKRSLYIALFLFICVTVYAYFINKAWEFWILGFVIAIILGGSQAVSRSLFSSLIPEGKHAEFFGFYAISAKFASVIGPFVFALITDLTGSARLAILALTSFFIIGIILLTFVDTSRQQNFSTQEL